MLRRISPLFCVLLICVIAGAQTTTPNIGLTLPKYGTMGWDTAINGNFSLIDTAIGKIQVPYRGTWSSSSVYQRGDWVTYSGGFYISQLNSNLNNLPTNATAWQNVPIASSMIYPSAGLAASTGSAWRLPTYVDVTNLFASGSCSGFLKSDGTCSTPSGIPYPPAGIAKSSGSAWVTPGFADVVSLWASGSCTSGYLKFDGTCSSPTGSGVQYNPSNTTYTVTGSSINGDDGHILGPTITVTGGSASGGVCTVTNSGTNGLAVGDWVYTAGITGWPAKSAGYGVYTYASGTVNDDQFQVIATGLSGTQFEFNCPNAGTATFTGGSAYPSNFWFTHLVEKQPFFNGHGTVNAIFDSTHTCSGINTNFSTLFPNVSGHTAYLILTDCHNEYNTGVSAATTEGYIQSIMAKAHTAGYVFVLGTTPNAQIAALNNGSYSFALNTVNWWSYLQGKSNANKTSGQYADYLADFNAPLSNYALFGGNNAGIGSPGGNQPAASILNEDLAEQAYSPKTQLFSSCYFGWYTGVTPSASGPGIVCSPASNKDAFVITDATQANVAFRVHTAGTIGAEAPNVIVDSLGSSANPVCTTTGGLLTNAGCASFVSTVSDPTDNSLFITPTAGNVGATLNLNNPNLWTNTQKIQAPSPTSSAFVIQATNTSEPTIAGSCGSGTCTINGISAGDTLFGVCTGASQYGTLSGGGYTFTKVNLGGTIQTGSYNYAYNVAANASATFSCTSGQPVVWDITNVPTSNVIDASYTDNGGTHTFPPGTITLGGATTNAKDLIITGIISSFDCYAGNPCPSSASAAGFVNQSSITNIFAAYRQVAATGTYSASWTWNNTSYMYMFIIAFKGATGGTQSADIADVNNSSGVTIAKFNSYGYHQAVASTFSTLPACTSILEGTKTAVTDSTTNTYGATITGSGSNHVPAYCNGTNWVVD